MQFSQLDAFLHLAECLNVTETARRMNCSQPAVSMKIRLLEQELDAVLFDRIGKRMHLTAQGRQFSLYASQMTNTLKAARENLHDLDDASRGTVSLGASHFIGVYLLPSLLARHRQDMPKVIFNLEIASSQQLIRQLEINALDVLILSDQIVFDPQRYHSHMFYQDKLVLVVPPQHRLASQGRCRLDEIGNDLFLIKPDQSATSTFLFERMQRAGFRPANVMHIGSLEGIKQGVIHQLGISIVSRFAVAHEITTGILAEVDIEDIDLMRGVHYVHHRKKYLTPATACFLRRLEAMADPVAGA